MITQDQLKEVKDRTEQLHRYLDIDNKKIQYEEEQLRTQAPGFWDDQKRAEAQMKLVKGLEKWLKGYAEVKTLCDELDTAFEFYKEELVTEDEVDAIYVKDKVTWQPKSHLVFETCFLPFYCIPMTYL